MSCELFFRDCDSILRDKSYFLRVTALSFTRNVFFIKYGKNIRKNIYILPISRNMWNVCTCFGCKHTLSCKTLMEVFPGTLRRNSIAHHHVTFEKKQLHSLLLIFITGISCKLWIPNLFIYSSIKDMQPL